MTSKLIRKQNQKDGRDVSVFLDSDTVQMLNEIKKKYPEGRNAGIIKTSIKNLHSAIFTYRRIKEPALRTEKEIVDELMNASLCGFLPKSQKLNIIRLIKYLMNDQNFDYGDVKDFFNKDIHVPNFKGSKWTIKYIRELLK